MSRKFFDEALNQLQDNVLALSSMAEQALTDAVDALQRHDLASARRLITEDRHINDRQIAIESQVLALIATQQPVARDMRILAGILEIAIELERIADYGKGIAKVTLMLSEQPLIPPLSDMPLMADAAIAMLRQALNAFVQREPKLAVATAQQDDEVDEFYQRIRRALFDQVMRNLLVFDQATYLLWAAHNLERAADRVVNICERVVYTATGVTMTLDAAVPSPHELALAV